jgi:hypothetical protein
MKHETATPSYDDYRAAGHDHETAEALVGVDAICNARAKALERLGSKGRARLERFYRNWSEKLDTDPKIGAERDRAAELRRRGERFTFDITERTEELRRQAFREVAPGSGGTCSNGAPAVVRRAESSGSPRASSSRSSSSSSARSRDPGDDPEPPGARPCACGCGRPRAQGAYYYDDKCRRKHARDRKQDQRARDRARDAAERPGVDRHRRDPYEVITPAELEELRKRSEIGCRCNGHHIPDGDDASHCIKCGHSRGGSHMQGGGRTYIQVRSLVSTHGLKKRKPRFGDRKGKPVTHKKQLPSGEVIPV